MLVEYHHPDPPKEHEGIQLSVASMDYLRGWPHDQGYIGLQMARDGFWLRVEERA